MTLKNNKTYVYSCKKFSEKNIVIVKIQTYVRKKNDFFFFLNEIKYQYKINFSLDVNCLIEI